MKKSLLALLCLLSLALACGCAEGGNESPSLPESGSTAQSTEETLPQDVSSAPEEISLPLEESFRAPSAEDSSEEPPAESSEESSEDSSDEEPPEESSEDSSHEEPPSESSEESEEEPMYTDKGDAEFIPSGYLLYNGAAYSQTHYNPETAGKYADVYAEYAKTFPGVGIHVINMPASVINIENPFVQEMVNDQGTVLDQNEAHIHGDVNFVNLKETFLAHRGEYLFFKSDFHWTQLGAYYAYQAFAKSVGLTPTPLSDFETEVTTETFIGLTNTYANDPRINSFFDTIHVYWPRKEHTMAVYLSDMSLYRTYKNCIQTSIKTYSCYLTGDQAYSEINVPENDQEKTVLVIKESSANAFVPFLTEHYGNIIVIDPRHVMLDVKKIVKEKGVDDIILFATASTCTRDAYCNYYKRLIGK